MSQGLPATFSTPLTDVSTVAARELLGSVRYDGGGKWYKYVKLHNATATVAAAAGSLVAYASAALSGYSGHRVVTDNTDADAAVHCAGATLATIAGVAGTVYYCWIQIKGLITLDTAIGSGAAGSPFYLTSTDKTGAIASAVTQKIGGVSVNATTLVCLDCVF